MTSRSISRLVLCSQLGMGLEAPVAIAFVYISPYLLQAGYTEFQSTMVLFISSLLGLLMSPTIGYLSDVTQSPIGKRRPYIIGLGFCTLVALLGIPRSRQTRHRLAFFVIILDSCSQICLSCTESLLADVFVEPFGVYSMMINLGSLFGYVFIILNDPEYHSPTSITRLPIDRQAGKLIDTDKSMKMFNVIFAVLLVSLLITILWGNEKTVNCRRDSKFEIQRLFDIPVAIQKIVLCDGLAWTSVLCFKYFFSDYCGRVVFGGKPRVEKPLVDDLRTFSRYLRRQPSTAVLLYNQGVRMAAFGLLAQSLFAAIASLFTGKLVKLYGIRNIYLAGMFTFGCCMAVLALQWFNNISWIHAVVAISGIGCMCATSMPFLLLKSHHDMKDDLRSVDTVKRGVGADIGLMDSSYFICQVALFAVVGLVYQFSLRLLMLMSSLLAFLTCLAIRHIDADLH